MADFWSGFLRTLAGGGAAILVLGFLGRELLRQLLAKDLDRARADRERDLEAFKASLSRELETYKGEIQRQTATAALKLSAVNERLHGILPDNYATFAEFRDAVWRYAYMELDPDSNEEKRRRKVDETWRSATMAFNKTVLYLPPQSLQKELHFIEVAVRCAQVRAVVEASGELRGRDLESTRRYFTEVVQPAVTDLWKDYRTLLGVETDGGGPPPEPLSEEKPT